MEEASSFAQTQSLDQTVGLVCLEQDQPTCCSSQKDSMVVDKERVITVSVGPEGSLLIWDPEDAVRLQQKYSIQGSSVGLYPRVPVQDTFLSLPVQLMPEEAAYLRDTNRARFIDAKGLVKIPSLADGIAFEDARQEQFQQQAELHEKLRAVHLDCHKAELYQKYLPELQQAFTKNGSAMPHTEEETWNNIRTRLLEQYDRGSQVINVELPTRSWRVTLGLLTLENIAFEYPVTIREKVLYATYRVLMDCGFSVTSGSNYGSDFLVFKGDPRFVYSTYMVKVIELERGENLDEYLRLGRVAATAKKAMLYSLVAPDLQVRLCCSKWALLK